MLFYVLDASGEELEIPLDVNDGVGEVDEELIGDPGEYGVHGQYLSAVRARKLILPCRTTPLDEYQAPVLRAALEGPPPLTFGGDWIERLGRESGYFQGIVGPIRTPSVMTGTDDPVRFAFEVREA